MQKYAFLHIQVGWFTLIVIPLYCCEELHINTKQRFSSSEFFWNCVNSVNI